MWNRISILAVAVVMTLLFSGTPALAQSDTMRLGGNIEAKTTTLAWDGQSDTTLMHGVRGYVGHRGFYGGGFGRSYYASYSYRPFYNSYSYAYRPFYNSYYSQPYYSSYYAPAYYSYPSYSSYYYPSYSSYYYPSYGSYYYPSYSYYSNPYYAPYSYYSSAYYYPINGNANASQAYRDSNLVVTSPQPTPKPQTVPMPPADNSTYPYDGGPANPIPAPKKVGDVKVLPSDARIVALPPQSTTNARAAGQFSYPAYGDHIQATTHASGWTPVTPPRKN